MIVAGDSPLPDALLILNKLVSKVVYVVDSEHLVGTITDGDIRRGLLNNPTGIHTVGDVMFRSPATVRMDTPESVLREMMAAKGISQLPIVDDDGRLLGIVELLNTRGEESRPNIAVVMCGGMGTRLGKFTSACPKPMLIVAGKPILEWIVIQLANTGITRIFLAINYLGGMIEKHFGDGGRFGVEISYIREEKRMGTAGALSLLPETPVKPVLVMNGDILTQFNLASMVEFHDTGSHAATMAIVEYKYQNPYGVVRHEGHELIRIDEKPVDLCFINAGIYMLSPEAVALVPKDEFFDMPALLEAVRAMGKKVMVFPVCEHWIDVGRETDYARVQELREDFFC